jgi:histidinol-phosphate phosphatase family protein
MNLLDIDVSGYETLFLDRDGVINKLRPDDYVKSWEEFEFLPHVLEAFARWNKHFKHIIVVSNQRGIGKGIMTTNDLDNIHVRMIEEIKAHDGRIDKIYFCPALSDTDVNRKPNIGMALQAKHDFPDIDFNKSMMIGDSDVDIQFAINAGMKGVKFLTSY